MLLSRSLKTIVLGLALAAPVFLGGCDRQSGDEPQPNAESGAERESEAGILDRSQKGAESPDLTVTDSKGNALELRSLRGKPVLINLWATWCAPCIAELPTLDQLAVDYAVRMEVLAISQDISQTERVAPFLADRGLMHLEPWLDPQADLSFALGGAPLPTTVLYDADGKEVWRFIGGFDWTSEEAAQMIAEALPTND